VLQVVAGGFFGDEGKGKIVSYLAIKDDIEIAVRTGAVNAGHTVVYSGRVFKLRIVPSAFVNRKTKLLIAPGALIRLDILQREIEETATGDRLFIDYNTGVIVEDHIKAELRDRYLSEIIKSTKQGVGAAMADRVLRRLRLAREYIELKKFLIDVPLTVNEGLERGLNVVIEGTQGTFLSLYHGTYPYVTSRDTTASGVLSEVGIGPKRADEVILVFKSYVTRVGAGPLEGELSEEEAERLGLVEYATVTGRRRRSALFNFNLARRAAMLNSPTQIAITKIDTLYPQAKGVREYSKLPREARKFIERIEEELKTPVTLIGTGPRVEDMVDLRGEKLGID